RNFFDPPGSEKPKLDQKQFGGVLTGPIIKNKTFFLVNYDGTRIDRGATQYFFVPLPDELAGHFTTPIRDPVNGGFFPTNPTPSPPFSPPPPAAPAPEGGPPPKPASPPA